MHRSVRTIAIVRVAAVLAIVAAFAGPALVRPQDPMSEPMHVAASMNDQMEALDALLAGRDPYAPPAGMDPVVWQSYLPADGAFSADQVALGRALYFDPRLSADDTVACATCHDVMRGFADQRMVSEGIDDQLGRRNAPTTMNAALMTPQFLDGRARDVDHQATMPITNPVEMGQPDDASLVAKLNRIPGYPEAFRKAYGRDITMEDVGRAIGAFERTLVFLDAPFDRFQAGDQDAISADARAGFDLFNGQARCVTCHPLNPSNPLGTNFLFHNIGVAARTKDFETLARQALTALAEDSSEQRLDELAVGTDLSELGRFMITRNRSEIGAFKTPQIRNAGITGPYMHDGSLQTLWDVCDHYNKGGEDNPFLDGGIEPLALTDQQIDQLVAFLFTLTDDRFAAQNDREFAAQKARAAKERPFKDEELAFRRKINFEDRVLGKTR
jgi:cytochrome c peroxidase